MLQDLAIDVVIVTTKFSCQNLPNYNLLYYTPLLSWRVCLKFDGRNPSNREESKCVCACSE
jgi:hypothetical protein